MKKILQDNVSARSPVFNLGLQEGLIYSGGQQPIQLPEIKMEGRSGCRLEVVKEDGRVLIRKYSSSIEYNRRLLKQAKKQEAFYSSLPENYIFSTAKVIESHSTIDSLAWFSMPYLFSEKYSNYFEQASIIDVKKVLNHLVDYFKFNLQKSRSEVVHVSSITSKIVELECKISENIHSSSKQYFLSILEYLKRNIPGSPLPIGTCHGDFTFSNILFDDSKIYLLDFLDSFIESPLIDIVKIRQDTCFKWSIMLEKEIPSHKKNKLIQTFNYLDKSIASFCDEQLGLTKWYDYLQIFNLLRIIPYLNNSHEIFFIEKSLRQLI